MTRATFRTSFKVKELQSWCVDGGRRLASAASAMTSKIKGQGHKVCLTRVGHTMKFALGGHCVLCKTCPIFTGLAMDDGQTDVSYQRKTGHL